LTASAVAGPSAPVMSERRDIGAGFMMISSL